MRDEFEMMRRKEGENKNLNTFDQFRLRLHAIFDGLHKYTFLNYYFFSAAINNETQLKGKNDTGNRKRALLLQKCSSVLPFNDFAGLTFTKLESPY